MTLPFFSVDPTLGMIPDAKKPKLMHGTLIMKDNVSEKETDYSSTCLVVSLLVALFFTGKFQLKRNSKGIVHNPSFLEAALKCHGAVKVIQVQWNFQPLTHQGW